MALSDQTLLHAQLTVPDQVVRRDFGEEAVALNLESGQYHGLNPTASAMLDALEDGATGDAVAMRFAEQYGQPKERVRDDVLALLRALTERGLVQVDDRSGS